MRGVRVNGVDVGSLGAMISDSEELAIPSTSYTALGRPLISPQIGRGYTEAKVVASASIGTFDLRLKARGSGTILFEKTGIDNAVDDVIDLGAPLARIDTEQIVDVEGRLGSAGDAATVQSVYVRF